MRCTNRSDEIARARLVDAYYARKDYAGNPSLYKDAGNSDNTDTGTILGSPRGSNSGVFQHAIPLLESALSSRPDNGPLYLALASYYRRIGNTKRAAELETKGKSLL